MSNTKANKQTAKKYEPSKKRISFHIRGFQHWDGALVLNELKAGDQLDLMPETDNPFDPQAIAIYYKDIKLGYIHSGENEIFSILMYFGHEDVFEARVMQVDPEAVPWEQVRIGIYVKDAR